MKHKQVERCYSVNFVQTPEERREKYAYARSRGMDSYMAARLRDFQWPNIEYVLEYWEEASKLSIARRERE